MDAMESVTDRCIRRALGFAALAIAAAMLALSRDPALALQAGANLVAVVAVALLLAAWQGARRDGGWIPPGLVTVLARQDRRADAQRRLRETFRRRLVWHAERVGLLAAALWALTAAFRMARAA